MSLTYEIRVLQPFTQAEIWPIVSGYETPEIYAVDKRETDEQTVIDLHLVQLEKSLRTAFYQDFSPEECRGWLNLLPQGYCFGAYQQERLIGFVIGETFPQDGLLRIWEFHVFAEVRRMGVGRALMEQEVESARRDRLETILLETQNTNVSAIRFYRSMGFTIESMDLSPAHYFNPEYQGPRQIAVYMKRVL